MFSPACVVCKWTEVHNVPFSAFTRHWLFLGQDVKVPMHDRYCTEVILRSVNLFFMQFSWQKKNGLTFNTIEIGVEWQTTVHNMLPKLCSWKWGYWNKICIKLWVLAGTCKYNGVSARPGHTAHCAIQRWKLVNEMLISGSLLLKIILALNFINDKFCFQI